MVGSLLVRLKELSEWRNPTVSPTAPKLCFFLRSNCWQGFAAQEFGARDAITTGPAVN